MARPDDADARQRLLARFVTVAAIVAGLVVLVVPLCSDGMSTMPVAADVSVTNPIGAPHDPGLMFASSGNSRAQVANPAVARCVAGATSPISSPAGYHIPTDELLACVAFAIAVLALVFGLQPPWSVAACVVRRAAEERLRLLGCPARRPALVELCVLRT